MKKTARFKKYGANNWAVYDKKDVLVCVVVHKKGAVEVVRQLLEIRIMKKKLSMKFEKYGARYWAVYDANGVMVCVTVYKKGAKELIRRLTKKSTWRANHVIS